MIKNDLVIRKEYIERFENMIEDIKEKGETYLCPSWDLSLTEKNYRKHIKEYDQHTGCKICYKYFKKVKHKRDCPCYIYTSAYLIKFLNKVINNSI